MKLILRRLTWLEEQAYAQTCGWGFWGDTPVEWRGKLWWVVR